MRLSHLLDGRVDADRTLRHSYGTDLIRNDVDIWRVQFLLGQTILNTVRVCFQSRDSDIPEAYDAVPF